MLHTSLRWLLSYQTREIKNKLCPTEDKAFIGLGCIICIRLSHSKAKVRRAYFRLLGLRILYHIETTMLSRDDKSAPSALFFTWFTNLVSHWGCHAVTRWQKCAERTFAYLVHESCIKLEQPYYRVTTKVGRAYFRLHCLTLFGKRDCLINRIARWCGTTDIVPNNFTTEEWGNCSSVVPPNLAPSQK